MNTAQFDLKLDDALRHAAATLALARDIEFALGQAAAASASERPWRCGA